MIIRQARLRARLALACLLALLLIVPVGAHAADEPVVKTRVTPDFPAGMMFEATIPIDATTTPIRASLFYRIASDTTLNEAPVSSLSAVADGSAVPLSRFIDLQADFVPPGVTLEFFWELTGDDASTIRTATETTLWTDSRFEWEVRQSGQITVYSYDTSEAFASWMLEESRSTLDDLQRRYALDDVGPVAIWIYPNASDFAGTRQANTREAIAGISYPGASLIVAVVPDGDEREFGRVIPHEISHQALFQATDNPFAPPPLWLDEGLATHYQTGGTAHYPGMVWRAATESRLFDITSLNTSFPVQPAQATLGYASSWSMVEYIETTYGTEGLSRLISAFGEGLPVENAISHALAVPAARLNADWHQWVLERGNPDK